MGTRESRGRLITVDRGLRVGVWNVQWATARSRGPGVRKRLEALRANVLVITEGCEAVLPLGGHVVTSSEDYGYRLVLGRRKVLLWSRHPWEDIDVLGTPALPSGRFVAATTSTPVGTVRVLGVCIPWKDAHVSTGQRNRCVWQDHLNYLHELRAIVARQGPGPVVLAGDFNQRVPRERQPKHVFDALQRALDPALQLATSGRVAGAGGRLIDHVAHSAALAPSKVEAWSRQDEAGHQLSDHDGVCVEYFAAGTR